MLAILGCSESKRPSRERLEGRLQAPRCVVLRHDRHDSLASGRQMSDLSHIIARYEVVRNARSLNSFCKEALVTSEAQESGLLSPNATGANQVSLQVCVASRHGWQIPSTYHKTRGQVSRFQDVALSLSGTFENPKCVCNTAPISLTTNQTGKTG
jgi:hypothetical protein